MMPTLLLFLPLLGSLMLHAPVLRFNLLRCLKQPIDGGRTFRGRRVFGDNKTWRGALAVHAVVNVIGYAIGARTSPV